MSEDTKPKEKKPSQRHATTKFVYTKLHIKFSGERKQLFIDKMKETGSRAYAMACCGIAGSTVCEHLANDPDFKQAYEDAKEWHVENYIVKEAQRRAVEGVKKAVYGGRFKDEVVGEETVYSDSLMSLFLKSKAKEFKPAQPGADINEKGVLVILGNTLTPEEWAKKYQALGDS